VSLFNLDGNKDNSQKSSFTSADGNHKFRSAELFDETGFTRMGQGGVYIEGMIEGMFEGSKDFSKDLKDLL
jgi:hypothetical protein